MYFIAPDATPEQIAAAAAAVTARAKARTDAMNARLRAAFPDSTIVTRTAASTEPEPF